MVLSVLLVTRPTCPSLSAGEGREEIVKVTFEELRQQVALFAAAMRKMGVRKGDRVVGRCPLGWWQERGRDGSGVAGVGDLG